MATIIKYLCLILFIGTVCSASVDPFKTSTIQSDGYYFEPPERIDHDGSEFTYPTYKFPEIPLYIFKYRASENKYCKLLAGLALYNLANVYSSQKFHDLHEEYLKRDDTECKFKVVNTKSDIKDEMEIYCGAMTSFIPLMTSSSTPDQGLLEIDDEEFVGLPVNLEVLNGTLQCFIETTDKSEAMPCDLLDKYATLSLFRVKIKEVNESHGLYYKAPESIDYGGSEITYPIYKSSIIPSYIFDYRASENKYRKLLAGLAIYNLASVHSNPKFYTFHFEYLQRDDIECKFKVVNVDNPKNKRTDEMVIFCGAMTSFIPLMSSSSAPDLDLRKIDENKFIGQPVNLETLNGNLQCFIETTNKSDKLPCDLLDMYSTLSFFRVTTKVNEGHGYHYAPPKDIAYNGSAEVKEFGKGTYPVYKELEIPSFIFEYRASENKYRKLLAGLALYNLAVIFSNNSKTIRDFNDEYLIHNYTRCIFNVVDQDYIKYDNIDVSCEAITSFIFQRHSSSDFTKSPDDEHGWDALSIDDAEFLNGTVNTTGLHCSVENLNRKSLDLEVVWVPCDLLELYTDKLLFSRSHSIAVSKPNIFLLCIITILMKVLNLLIE